MSSPVFARCAPFVLYMAFIALDQGLRSLIGTGNLPLSESSLLYLYPVKAIVVALSLLALFRRYDELHFGDLKNLPATCASLAVGILVFVLWINMAWTLQDASVVLHDLAGRLGIGLSWAPKGVSVPAGYDPFQLQSPQLRSVLIVFRLFGAAVVVPVMEELFWRSFLLRYLVDNDFTRVSVGTFTWGSFLIVTFLFGVEHDYLFAGMVAGIAYNLLAVYTRSIAQCVLSHSVTNLVLGVYVLSTGKWQFW